VSRDEAKLLVDVIASLAEAAIDDQGTGERFNTVRAKKAAVEELCPTPDEPAKPYHGQLATCKSCSQQIQFVDSSPVGYWSHTKGNYRHPATPKQ